MTGFGSLFSIVSPEFPSIVSPEFPDLAPLAQETCTNSPLEDKAFIRVTEQLDQLLFNRITDHLTELLLRHARYATHVL